VPIKKKTVTSGLKHPGILDLNTKASKNPRPRAVPKPRLASTAELDPKLRPAVKSKAARKPKTGGIDKTLPAKHSLRNVVIGALADMKALEVKVLDVRGLTDIADFMVIASGTSDRHVRSVAQRVVEKTKEAGFRPHGVEGQQDGDWVLIDLNEMIVHVMLPRVREFYGLEKLWDITATKRAARA